MHDIKNHIAKAKRTLQLSVVDQEKAVNHTEKQQEASPDSKRYFRPYKCKDPAKSNLKKLVFWLWQYSTMGTPRTLATTFRKSYSGRSRAHLAVSTAWVSSQTNESCLCKSSWPFTMEVSVITSYAQRIYIYMEFTMTKLTPPYPWPGHGRRIPCGDITICNVYSLRIARADPAETS